MAPDLGNHLRRYTYAKGTRSAIAVRPTTSVHPNIIYLPPQHQPQCTAKGRASQKAEDWPLPCLPNIKKTKMAKGPRALEVESHRARTRLISGIFFCLHVSRTIKTSSPETSGTAPGDFAIPDRPNGLNYNVYPRISCSPGQRSPGPHERPPRRNDVLPSPRRPRAFAKTLSPAQPRGSARELDLKLSKRSPGLGARSQRGPLDAGVPVRTEITSFIFRSLPVILEGCALSADSPPFTGCGHACVRVYNYVPYSFRLRGHPSAIPRTLLAAVGSGRLTLIPFAFTDTPPSPSRLVPALGSYTIPS